MPLALRPAVEETHEDGLWMQTEPIGLSYGWAYAFLGFFLVVATALALSVSNAQPLVPDETPPVVVPSTLEAPAPESTGGPAPANRVVG